MPKLNDTQTILLSTAAQRDDGSLLPLPASHASGLAKARATKAIAALLKLGLARRARDHHAGEHPPHRRRRPLRPVPDRRRQGRNRHRRRRRWRRGEAPCPARRSTERPIKDDRRHRAPPARHRRHHGRADRGHRLAAAHDARGADRPAQEGPRDRPHASATETPATASLRPRNDRGHRANASPGWRPCRQPTSATSGAR